MKSFGTTTWTDAKTGGEKSKFGLQYIHFVDECLKNYDTDKYCKPDRDCFNHGRKIVDSFTLTYLNEEEKLLQDFGVNIYYIHILDII